VSWAQAKQHQPTDEQTRRNQKLRTTNVGGIKDGLKVIADDLIVTAVLSHIRVSSTRRSTLEAMACSPLSSQSTTGVI
jgi:hypothetical protein